MRKREPRNNKTTRASQHIEHVEDLDAPKKKARPKGRNAGTSNVVRQDGDKVSGGATGRKPRHGLVE